MNYIMNLLRGSFPWISALDFGIFLLGSLVVIFVLAFYVYRDSSLRGGKSLLWTICTILFGGILPFLFYMIVRSSYTKEELEEEKLNKELMQLQRNYYELMASKEIQKCPVCGEEVSADYMYCPKCFTQLKKHCDECKKIVDKDAKICPYCGHIFGER